MSLLNWWWRRRDIERDVDEELDAHLRLAIADRVAAGEDPASARFNAMKDFGNVLQANEETRHVWRGDAAAALADVWQDVRFGVRMLAKNRGFSLVVIAVLTLGIAGNAAVFSLFKGLALKPLPGVRNSASMAVMLSRTGTARPMGLSVPDYRYIREHDRAFVDLAASCMIFASAGLGADAERVTAELVTGNYFHALGVNAQLGRVILPSDDVAPGQHPVAVIGDGLWRRTFGGDRDVIGKTLYLNGQPLTIVGVADAEFRGTVVSMVADVFAPIMMQPQVFPPNRLEQRSAPMMMTIGHLRQGVTVAEAAAQTRVLASQLDTDNPIPNITTRADVVPIWQSPFGAQTYMLPAIGMLGVMGVLILLVVCANVANLVLVRGVSRRGELAVRLALGASRGRLVRLLFVENLVLALPGALGGIILAAALVPYIGLSTGGSAPGSVYLDTTVDAYVITFGLILSGLCAIVFGFAPALKTSNVEIVTLMNDISPRLAARGRLRALLVVSQVAVSLILLVGAGLVLRSYLAARQADGGFDGERVTSTAIDLQTGGYDESGGLVVINRFLDAVESDPAFESTSLAAYVPLSLVDTAPRAITIEGYAPRSGEDLAFLHNVVGPGYFRTLRIPIVTGREFTRRDGPDAEQVVIVNETLARRMWHTPEGAIGKRLRAGTGAWRTVVGVARDVKYARLSEEPRPYVYYPLMQSYQPQLTIHARAVSDTSDALKQVRQHINALNPQIPIGRSVMLREQTQVALAIYQMAAGAITMFGVMTILLAAIGIYGMVAYTVQQSTQEIGIRMAVGARRADVVWTFLRRGTLLAATGAGIGLVGAIAVSGTIRSLLYGVGPRDAVSLLAGTAVVMTIALAASLVPALRAARTDPLSALRHR
jgi:predicted permease